MSQRKPQPLTQWILFPFFSFCYLLRVLGPGLLGSFGNALGTLLFHLRFRRKIVVSNLQLAFSKSLSEQEILLLAKKIYSSLGITFLEIARNFVFTREDFKNELLLSDADRKYIQERLARGRGIVFISAHIANWELLAMGMAAHGFPTTIVVKKMSARVSQYLIERQRTKTGLEIIYSGGVLEKMKTALSQGRVIGFMMDQNTTGKKGIRTNFFGIPASTIRGLAKLVKATETVVIPICAFRQPDGSHRVQLLPELSYLTDEAVSDPEEKELREEWLNTQQYQSAIETLVRMHPEQWLWIHRRWKARRDPLCAETAHLENRADT